ncbi:hypothetical protein N2152v2_003555 [Parachlorella kessleri]
MRQVVRNSPKHGRRPQAAKALQLAIYTAWPALLIWLLVSGRPSRDGSGAAPQLRQGVAHRHSAASRRLGETQEPATLAQETQPEVQGDLNQDVQTQPQQLDKQPQQVQRGGQQQAQEWWQGSEGSTAQPKQRADEQVLAEAAAADAAGAAAAGGLHKPQKSTEQQGLVGDRIMSSLKVHPTRDSKGMPTKYYYSFQNVRLTRTKMQFFAPPDFTYPTQPNWVDIVTGNATGPEPPTMLLLKGEAKNTKWFYLPVKYFSAAKGPANCRGWVDKPTYLLQVRYSWNIWHTWNEGLMAAFQTLREQGHLPLVQVDHAGNMREVTEGMGGSACPEVVDPATDTPLPDTTCPPKTGAVQPRLCDAKNQRWCRPGVWSHGRDDGPLLLPYTPSSVMNQWAQIYAAMSEDVRDWSLVDGFCFRNLIVGHTNTLNYYQAMNDTGTPAAREQRVEAMGVFKAFVATAQQDWLQQEAAKRPSVARYKGYADKALERLRRGIGPEDVSLVSSVMPTEVPGLLGDEASKLYKDWQEKKRTQEEAERAAALEQALDKLDAGATVAAASASAGDTAAAKALLGLWGGGGGSDGGAGGRGASANTSSGGGEGVALIPNGASGDGQREAEASGGLLRRRLAGETLTDFEEGTQRQQQQQQQQQGQGVGSGEAGPAEEALNMGGAAGSGAAAAAGLQLDVGAAAAAAAAWQDSGGDDAGDGGEAAADGGDSQDSGPQQPQESEEEEEEEEQEGGLGTLGGEQGAEEQRQQQQQPVWGEEGDEEEQEEPPELDMEEAVRRMPPVVPRGKLPLEAPRPVVTYMMRNFFSRRVLNDHDILRYVLERYNVTLRVTTFEEPLLEVLNLMQHTDVLIGMHGAGWTNALFIKHGATAVQLYPYGWRLPGGAGAIRGFNYREIVLANECGYLQWFNPHPHLAFVRREDFPKKLRATDFRLHFDPQEPHPVDGWPGNQWIYQNTYVDMASLGPVIDEAMCSAGIAPMAQQPPTSSS